jgi:hypothetical protein
MDTGLTYSQIARIEQYHTWPSQVWRVPALTMRSLKALLEGLNDFRLDGPLFGCFLSASDDVFIPT